MSGCSVDVHTFRSSASTLNSLHSDPTVRHTLQLQPTKTKAFIHNSFISFVTIICCFMNSGQNDFDSPHAWPSALWFSKAHAVDRHRPPVLHSLNTRGGRNGKESCCQSE